MNVFWMIVVSLAGCVHLAAQAPGVPTYPQGRKATDAEAVIRKTGQDLFTHSNALHLAEIKEQLKQTSCRLELPAPRTAKLSPREIWTMARASHLSRNDSVDYA